MDYYLEDIARLEGQPKRFIGDYVESQGILVPRRFASLEEAIKFKGKVLVRSEHTQDYYGEGNLFHSPVLDKRRRNYDQLRAYLIQSDKNRINTEFTQDDDTEKIKREVSYSFWELLLKGQNRTMVADNGIKDRYHIFTNHADGTSSWVIAEEGKIIFGEEAVDQNLTSNLARQIEFYESVRRLPRFDSNHCPAIEYQSVGSDNLFLQYFRTTDFQRADFTLSRDLEEREIQLEFVRGTTSLRGIQYRLTWPQSGGRYKVSEDPKITLQHIPLPMSWFMGYHHTTHLRIEQIFKQTVCLIGKLEALYDKEELSKLFLQAYGASEGEKMEVPLVRIISDGRKAYVKRLD